MSYSGSGRVMNMLKREKSLKRMNSWSLCCFVAQRVEGGSKASQWVGRMGGQFGLEPIDVNPYNTAHACTDRSIHPPVHRSFPQHHPCMHPHGRTHPRMMR